jgi:hypothetical protein
MRDTITPDDVSETPISIWVAAIAAFVFVLALGQAGCAADPGDFEILSSTGQELVDCNLAVEGHKITICHHTGSATNPYVGITIAVKGCIAGHQAEHPEDLNPVDGACPTCVADGHACLEDGACCDGVCTDGICGPPACTATGDACASDAECCSGSCCTVCQ